jgi:hypothetical protein
MWYTNLGHSAMEDLRKVEQFLEMMLESILLNRDDRSPVTSSQSQRHVRYGNTRASSELR